MKFVRWFAEGVGYAVVTMFFMGQLLEEVNFRLCFGPAANCRFITEQVP